MLSATPARLMGFDCSRRRTERAVLCRRAPVTRQYDGESVARHARIHMRRPLAGSEAAKLRVATRVR